MMIDNYKLIQAIKNRDNKTNSSFFLKLKKLFKLAKKELATQEDDETSLKTGSDPR